MDTSNQNAPVFPITVMGFVVLFNLGIMVGLVLQALPSIGSYQVLALAAVEAAVVWVAYRNGKRSNAVYATVQ